MTNATNCLWCKRAFKAHKGGTARRFCSINCRHEFHSSARRWAERAVASGMLSIAELRGGDPAACTLAGDGKSPAPVREQEKGAVLLDELLGVLLGDACPNEILDALPEDTLERIIAYLDELEP
jgi:hypothetical protein